MNNADFWASMHSIIAEGFTPEGLLKLDRYAELFISGRMVYQRFSPQEQHGCSAGGTTNVIASLLAGAEAGTDSENQAALGDYQRECQLGAQQEIVIEQWAKAVGLWTECVEETLPKSLGEQIAEGGEAVVYDHGSMLRWRKAQCHHSRYVKAYEGWLLGTAARLCTQQPQHCRQLLFWTQLQRVAALGKRCRAVSG